MGSYSPNSDWTTHHPDTPVLSVIVSVDTINEQAPQCLDDILKVIGDSPCEVLVASREIWPDPPPELTVVSCASDSRGERYDRAAWRARGRILAFLDDGVCLPDGWPDRVIDFFDDPDVAIAGGPVLVRTRSRADRVGALLIDHHLGATRMGSVSSSARPQVVAELTESNVLIRKDVFRRVGGFRSPRTGGETMRLCHAVRSLLGCKVHYRPDLAVFGSLRSFPGPFLADVAAHGRARGETARVSLVAAARRFPTAQSATDGRASVDDLAPSVVAFAFPTLLVLLVFLEVVLAAPFTPFRHLRLAEYIGATLLLVLYLIQVGRVALARGAVRIEDRALAALCLPLASVTYLGAFALGFFDTR